MHANTLGRILMHSVEGIGIWVLFYYTETLKISIGKYIQQGGALTNIGLWGRLHVIQIGVFKKYVLGEALEIWESDKELKFMY